MMYKKILGYSWELFLEPFAILWILNSAKIHPPYRVGFFRKLCIGSRFYLNRLLIPTGANPKMHLAMALKLLEIGIVVECGTWKGGTAANLSIICRLTGRQLFIFDSFRGLPPADPDRKSVV